MPIIAKGYAVIPKYHEGGIIYDGTPELMMQYAIRNFANFFDTLVPSPDLNRSFCR